MKMKITLRWRITLLTIVVMCASSIALVIFININTSIIMPRAAKLVVYKMTAATTPASSDKQAVILGTDDTDSATSDKLNGNTPPGAVIVTRALDDAASDMYWASFLILICTSAIGGICAYYISGSALRPIKVLNDTIKKVNVHNLTNHLSLDGPQDEVMELTISFNSMLAKLNNAFSSQKRFNASMAHELKTPLAAMKANIDVLNEQDERNMEDYQNVLSIVAQSVVKMNATIEALLDMAYEEYYQMNDEIRADALVCDVVEDLEQIAEQHKIKLDCRIEKVPVIWGNEILLYRAIYNVVENAIKYTPPHGTVTVICSESNNHVVINISDTGCGIAGDEADDIFRPYYRIRSNCEQSGLGLGLTFTKSAVAAHGGEICFESEPGQGTVFKISLPAIQLNA